MHRRRHASGLRARACRPVAIQGGHPRQARRHLWELPPLASWAPSAQGPSTQTPAGASVQGGLEVHHLKQRKAGSTPPPLPQVQLNLPEAGLPPHRRNHSPCSAQQTWRRAARGRPGPAAAAPSPAQPGGSRRERRRQPAGRHGVRVRGGSSASSSGSADPKNALGAPREGGAAVPRGFARPSSVVHAFRRSRTLKTGGWAGYERGSRPRGICTQGL